jgi:flavorubredoxin
MTITNTQSGTNVHEISSGIYRISTPVPPSQIPIPGGFTFNQFLVVDDAPLLFHTGPRGMFPLVQQAVAHVLGDVAKLRYVGFSHVEADECGSLNEWLKVAPQAQAVCSTTAAMVSVNDLADRAPRGLADGEELLLGEKRMRWLDAPHLPHNWECGYMFESKTRTLLCGDLFTHGGSDLPALTESDVFAPAEAMRLGMPTSVAITREAQTVLAKLAATEPATLALMHGSSYRGDGANLLNALASVLRV